MGSRAPLTNVQKKVQRNIDAAMDTCIKYAASEVPPLENLTIQGLTEELGYVNAAKKQIEKVEKILKERWKALKPVGESEVRSDNFTVSIKGAPRVALDQTAAKDYFEKQGILADFMSETIVDTITCKENG